jgi:hypothetical protein
MSERQPRRKPAVRARVVGAWLAAWLAIGAPSAAFAQSAAPLYQWTDERGNVRYTPDPERVPSSRRGTLIQLEPGMPAPPAASRPREAAAEPAPTPNAASVPNAAPAPGAVPTPGAAPAPGTVPTPSAAPASRRAAAPPPAAAVAPLGTADAAREQQLVAAITADEEALKALIAAPREEGEPGLGESAELRAIAQRLPGLQAELRALRERRAPPAPR